MERPFYKIDQLHLDHKFKLKRLYPNFADVFLRVIFLLQMVCLRFEPRKR